jgi:hypothetical protein
VELKPEDLTPFLTPKQATDSRVESWASVLAALLTQRYGDRITSQLRPVFVSAAADAIGRRADKTSSMVAQESIGPASVRWETRSSLGGWFLPEELAQLDQLTSGVPTGTSTVRMSAPDGQRFGNVHTHWEDDDDLLPR